MSKNPHAVALGKKGGRSTSEAKQRTARENGKKARKCQWCKAGSLDYTNPANPFCHSCKQSQEPR